MPEKRPHYPHHTQLWQYFNDYCEAFGVWERITFRTKVEYVEPLGGPGGREGYRVTVRDLDSGETKTVGRPEGALSFTTGDPLTTGRVSRLLQKVIARKKVEACRPNPFFSKLINILPPLSLKLYGAFQQRGLKAAAKVRRQREGA